MWVFGGVLTDAIIAICNIRDGLTDRAAFSSSFGRGRATDCRVLGDTI